VRGKRLLQDWPIWRYVFGPLNIPRYWYIGPIAVGAVFATILGILMGLEGVALGLIIGLCYGGAAWANVLFVRWLIKKRNQGK
jgi:hypothetical protein